MNLVPIRELTLARFNALAGYSRSPVTEHVVQELAWYSDEAERVLAVVIRDVIDGDFAGVIMARDQFDVFRCVDTESSLPNQRDAIAWVHRMIRNYAFQETSATANSEGQAGLDLFRLVVAAERVHPHFSRLANAPHYLSARGLINAMMPYYVDVDGNFVEQFQSVGFDARVWELYLYNYLVEEKLFLDRSAPRPDFMASKYGKKVAIEAVTVGRQLDNLATLFGGLNNILNAQDVRRISVDEMPIRFGSPLYSKLCKQYWNLKHVRGNPLVFAIADFHADLSMTWSSTSLINYLYGVRHEHHFDKDGNLIITPQAIVRHELGAKEIPSGFFFQPNAENVSAILFSASGTISKFNRLGRQAGFVNPTVTMIRIGTCYNHEPNATEPLMFRYVVDESSGETWAEGMSMFHNPNALHPVPRELFPSIAHHDYIDGQIHSEIPEFYVYSSITHTVNA